MCADVPHKRLEQRPDDAAEDHCSAQPRAVCKAPSFKARISNIKYLFSFLHLHQMIELILILIKMTFNTIFWFLSCICILHFSTNTIIALNTYTYS